MPLTKTVTQEEYLGQKMSLILKADFDASSRYTGNADSLRNTWDSKSSMPLDNPRGFLMLGVCIMEGNMYRLFCLLLGDLPTSNAFYIQAYVFWVFYILLFYILESFVISYYKKADLWFALLR